MEIQLEYRVGEEQVQLYRRILKLALEKHKL